MISVKALVTRWKNQRFLNMDMFVPNMRDDQPMTTPTPSSHRIQFLRREPLYAKVEREISESILGGKWERGSPLPGELEMAAQYGVSVGTVRRALTSLVNTGFLERRPRLGTFVTDRSPHHSLRFLHHYYRLHGQDGSLLTSTPHTLSLKTSPATERERANLNMSGSNTDVIRIHRMRTVFGKPAAHDTIILPVYRFPNFPKKDELPELIIPMLEEKYGVRLTSARESLWADTATADDQRILNISENTPMLVIDHIAHDTTNAPVELFTGRFVSKGFRYVNEVR